MEPNWLKAIKVCHSSGDGIGLARVGGTCPKLDQSWTKGSIYNPQGMLFFFLLSLLMSVDKKASGPDSHWQPFWDKVAYLYLYVDLSIYLYLHVDISI